MWLNFTLPGPHPHAFCSLRSCRTPNELLTNYTGADMIFTYHRNCGLFNYNTNVDSITTYNTVFSCVTPTVRVVGYRYRCSRHEFRRFRIRFDKIGIVAVRIVIRLRMRTAHCRSSKHPRIDQRYESKNLSCVQYKNTWKTTGNTLHLVSYNASSNCCETTGRKRSQKQLRRLYVFWGTHDELEVQRPVCDEPLENPSPPYLRLHISTQFLTLPKRFDEENLTKARCTVKFQRLFISSYSRCVITSTLTLPLVHTKVHAAPD